MKKGQSNQIFFLNKMDNRKTKFGRIDSNTGIVLKLLGNTMSLIFFRENYVKNQCSPPEKKILIKSLFHDKYIGRTRSAKYFFC
jgi:hypothetical protein